jgi:hypothetical protein
VLVTANWVPDGRNAAMLDSTRRAHLLRWALRGSPQLDPPLQGPDLPIAELPRVLPLQPLEQCLGFQPRTLLDLPLNCVPHLAERILPRPPLALPLQLAGQPF